jgi:hypothetical protein
MTYRTELEEQLTAQLLAKYSDPLAYATVSENGRLAFLYVSGQTKNDAEGISARDRNF